MESARSLSPVMFLRRIVALVILSVILLGVHALAPAADTPTSDPDMLDRALQGWINELGAEKSTTRDRAVERLRNLGRDAIPALEGFTEAADPEQSARARAVLAAAGWRSREDAEEEVRRQVERSAPVDEAFPDVVWSREALEWMFSESSHPEGENGPLAASHPALVTLGSFGHPDWMVAHWAKPADGMHPASPAWRAPTARWGLEEGLPALERDLFSPGPGTNREIVANCLAHVGIAAARELLERAAADEDPAVDRWALIGLGDLADPRSVPLLARVLRSRFGGPETDMANSRPILPPELRFRAAEALGAIRTPESAAALREELLDDDDRVIGQCLRTLSGWGDRACLDVIKSRSLADRPALRPSIAMAWASLGERAHAAEILDWFVHRDDNRGIVGPDVDRQRLVLASALGVLADDAVATRLAARITGPDEASDLDAALALWKRGDGRGWNRLRLWLEGDTPAPAPNHLAYFAYWARLHSRPEVMAALVKIAESRVASEDARAAAVASLGALHHRRAVMLAEHLIAEPGAAHDPMLAYVMARLGATGGIPHVLEACHDASLATRREARDMLRKLAGTDFGFVPDGPFAARRRAILRGKVWWEMNRTTFHVGAAAFEGDPHAGPAPADEGTGDPPPGEAGH